MASSSYIPATQAQVMARARAKGNNPASHVIQTPPASTPKTRGNIHTGTSIREMEKREHQAGLNSLYKGMLRQASLIYDDIHKQSDKRLTRDAKRKLQEKIDGRIAEYIRTRHALELQLGQYKEAQDPRSEAWNSAKSKQAIDDMEELIRSKRTSPSSRSYSQILNDIASRSRVEDRAQVEDVSMSSLPSPIQQDVQSNMVNQQEAPELIYQLLNKYYDGEDLSREEQDMVVEYLDSMNLEFDTNNSETMDNASWHGSSAYGDISMIQPVPGQSHLIERSGEANTSMRSIDLDSTPIKEEDHSKEMEIAPDVPDEELFDPYEFEDAKEVGEHDLVNPYEEGVRPSENEETFLPKKPGSSQHGPVIPIPIPVPIPYPSGSGSGSGGSGGAPPPTSSPPSSSPVPPSQDNTASSEPPILANLVSEGSVAPSPSPSGGRPVEKGDQSPLEKVTTSGEPPLKAPNQFTENMKAISQSRIANPLTVKDVYRARGGEDKRIWRGDGIPAGFKAAFPAFDPQSLKLVIQKELLPYQNFSFWKGHKWNPLNPKGIMPSKKIADLRKAGYFVFDHTTNMWERLLKSEMPNSRRIGQYLERLQLKRSAKDIAADSLLRPEEEEKEKKKRKLMEENVLVANNQKGLAEAKTLQKVEHVDNVLAQKERGRQ